VKRRWSPEDLEHHWGLLPQEEKLLRNKTGATRLGFALLLKFFQMEGRFPSGPHEVPSEALVFLTAQLGISAEAWADYPWDGITIRRHRAEIRTFEGFREATVKDSRELEAWLLAEVLPSEHREERLREAALARCRALKIEPPGPERLKRHIRAAAHAYETGFSERIFQRLPTSTVHRLGALLDTEPAEPEETAWTAWQSLKAEPGKAGVESVKEAAARLRQVWDVGLPADLFRDVPPKVVERYAKRTAVEEPHELRRHPGPLQATLLAAYLHRRSEVLTDHLVDLLVEIIHKMGKRAEKKVEEELSGQLQKVPGKLGVLVRIAEASLNMPEGVVNQVIFPVASEKLLKSLLQEPVAQPGDIKFVNQTRASIEPKASLTHQM